MYVSLESLAAIGDVYSNIVAPFPGVDIVVSVCVRLSLLSSVCSSL